MANAYYEWAISLPEISPSFVDLQVIIESQLKIGWQKIVNYRTLPILREIDGEGK